MKPGRTKMRVIHTIIMLAIVAFGSEMTAADLKHVDARSGELHILTYNVKGLLPFFSTDGRDNQRENNRLISPLLNNYALVLVQEDFFYHDELSAETTHAYQSRPTGPFCIKFFFTRLCILPGDGLARFSGYTFEQREPDRFCQIKVSHLSTSPDVLDMDLKGWSRIDGFPFFQEALND